MISKEVRELFLELEQSDLLQDRSEYGFQDLADAYPSLKNRDVVDLYILISLWRDSDKSTEELLSTYSSETRCSVAS